MNNSPAERRDEMKALSEELRYMHDMAAESCDPSFNRAILKAANLFDAILSSDLPKSATVGCAPHNSGERLPSSDAAAAVAGTSSDLVGMDQQRACIEGSLTPENAPLSGPK